NAAPAPSRPAEAAPAPRARAGTVAVIVDTIAIDRRGTWTAGTDEARIASGTDGVLEKSIALIGRQDPGTREMVQLTARLAPVLRVDGTCRLGIDSEVTPVIGGAAKGAPSSRPHRRSLSLDLAAGEERLVEVYSSSHTQARIGLKVRCSEAVVEGVPDARFVRFHLSVARAEEDRSLELLKTNVLRAAVGREAGNVFSFNVPLEETPRTGARYRREHVEVKLVPVLFGEGRLQTQVEIKGELATVSANEATTRHPFARSVELDQSSGGVQEFDFEISSSGAEEGWTRVRYRLTVVCSY
ncbi:MAG: hypothetical protein ACRD6R_08840, partial [Candidatus Polarisedimenticolia bacterium]